MKIKKFLMLIAAVAIGVSLCSCTDKEKTETPTSNSNDGASSDIPSTSGNIPDDGAPPTVDSPVNETISKQEIVSLVVLGDSIAKGYGLENEESERFSAILAENLRNNYNTVNICNYGVNRLTGQGLAEMLKTNPPKELVDCDYVLISIGGNNVLGRLPEILNISDFQQSIDKNLLTDYFRYITSAEPERAQYAHAIEALNSLFGSVNESFKSETFSNIVSEAKANLEKELPLVINTIREINPKAEIIVQTVYNPYKNISVKLPYVSESVIMDTHGNTAINGLNQVITSFSSQLGYKVAEVYNAFQGADESPLNAKFGLDPIDINLDPHPNKIGHKIIADVYYKLIIKGE